MKLIVGLGNPGSQYAKTRHNVGFLILDELAHQFQADWSVKKRWKSEVAEFSIDDERILLIKPQTFMNRSGEAVQAARGFFKKVSIDNIIVIHDDIDLVFGDIRVKQGGSSAGHRGINSITQQINNRNFHRIRIGIGRPDHKDLPIEDWVLKNFSESEWQSLPGVYETAINKLKEFING